MKKKSSKRKTAARRIRTFCFVLAAALAVMSLTSCGDADEQKDEAGEGPEEEEGEGPLIGGFQIPNPWTDCEDKAAAEELAGFKINAVKELVKDCDRVLYRVMKGEQTILEAIYYDENGVELLRVRKAPGSGDISGDFNVYTENLVACGEKMSYELGGYEKEKYLKARIDALDGSGDPYTYSINVPEERPLSGDDV